MKATGAIIGSAAVLAVVAASYFMLRPAQGKEANSEQGTGNRTSQPLTPDANLSTPAAQRSTPNAQHSTLNAQRSTLNALTLLGTVQPGMRADISVSQPVRITAVLVKEGQTVRQGQLLVVFDAEAANAGEQSAQSAIRTAQAQVDKARAGRSAQLVKADADVMSAQTGITQAQARLRQAQTGVQAARTSDQADLDRAQGAARKAQTALEEAQKNVRSLEELSKVGGVARNDLEGAKAQATLARVDLDTAQAAVRSIQAGPSDQPGISFRVANAQQEVSQAHIAVQQAQTGLAVARKARTQILAVANAEMQAARAGVQQAQAGLAGAQIGPRAARQTSPISGVATNVTAHIGETAQPGMPLLTIVSLEGARIEALVPARQLPTLHVGQTAHVLLDTRPNQPLPAILNAISRVAEPDGRTFRITFRLTQAQPLLRVGQTARISVER